MKTNGIIVDRHHGQQRRVPFIVIKSHNYMGRGLREKGTAINEWGKSRQECERRID